MKILALLLLPLGFCAAQPIRYEISNDSYILASFVSPDFLPSVPTATANHWTVAQSSLTGTHCNNPSPLVPSDVCTQLDIDLRDTISQFRLTSYPQGYPSDLKTALIGAFPSTLQNFGQYRSGENTLYVLGANGDSFAPEPAAWGLFAIAGLLLSSMSRLRRAKNARS